MKIDLLGYSITEMEQLAARFGEKPFKGRQLFKWLYNENQSDFSKMTNLSKSFRKRLAQETGFNIPIAEEKMVSADGTEKFLFRLNDGKLIESVIIPDGIKNTACISSQVGCALGCKYCATGRLGFGRDLTVGEIVGQLLYMRRSYGNDAFHNIVFMGMGEPLLNYDNLIAAVNIISSDIGLSVSAGRITVSTAGIIPQIYNLADSGLKVKLAISLNSPFDAKRKLLMPIARKYNINKLMEAAEYFARKRKRRVTFEYILFAGLNDSIEDALELSKRIKGIPCKINLLAYNPINGLDYHCPSEDQINNFAKVLFPRAPAVTVRKSRGVDIAAACGQLAGGNISHKKRSSG
jgi:23S rRNA (adenine2503-C2)-methyltransferase